MLAAPATVLRLHVDLPWVRLGLLSDSEPTNRNGRSVGLASGGSEGVSEVSSGHAVGGEVKQEDSNGSLPPVLSLGAMPGLDTGYLPDRNAEIALLAKLVYFLLSAAERSQTGKILDLYSALRAQVEILGDAEAAGEVESGEPRNHGAAGRMHAMIDAYFQGDGECTFSSGATAATVATAT